jgi:hypothetical protein
MISIANFLGVPFPEQRDDSASLHEKYRPKDDSQKHVKAEARRQRREAKRSRDQLKSASGLYPGHACHQSGQGLSS